jgi:uncharacterized protein Ymh
MPPAAHKRTERGPVRCQIGTDEELLKTYDFPSHLFQLDPLPCKDLHKCLDNEVKSRSGSDQDGAALMQHALSLAAPRIKLNSLETKSERDEQLGYMQTEAGCPARRPFRPLPSP